MASRITGKYSSTDSDGSQISNPVGRYAHAEGFKTKATGITSHAEGYQTNAPGNYAHSEGYQGNASGQYSHVEGYACVASGDNGHAEGWNSSAYGGAAHAEGYQTTAQSDGCHSEGYQTTAVGGGNHAEGMSTTASGGSSAHAQNRGCIASGNYSHAQGWNSRASRSSQHSNGASQFASAGDAQLNTFPAAAQTTDATPKVLTFDNSGTPGPDGGSSCNVLTIPVNRAHVFTINVIARRSDVSGDAAAWLFTGMVVRGSSGSADFGTGGYGPVTDYQTWYAGSAGAWDVSLSIDTTSATNNYLKITATGEAAKTIRWVARIDTAEVG